ncbi:regulator [Vibrio cholerae]|uniref:regulator n=1 Tax=Vibrio cholerae TaxID=666 RepID=UPI00313AE569
MVKVAVISIAYKTTDFGSFNSESKRNDKKLCFKTVSEVKRWDEGEKIPPICKRLMRWHSRKELYYGNEWWGFRMEGGRLILPTGDRVAPQQILFAIAIMQIEAPEHDLARSKLLKYARAMVRIKGL